MRAFFAFVSFLVLAGCGGGGGGGGGGPTPPTLYNLDASVWPPASPGVWGGTVSITGGTTAETGQFAAGAVVTLTAHPDAGNVVATWSGTDNDSSTANTNTVTMPASNHSVEVSFMPAGSG